MGQPERLVPLESSKGQPAPLLTGRQWTCIYNAACSAVFNVLALLPCLLLAAPQAVWLLRCICFLAVLTL